MTAFNHYSERINRILSEISDVEQRKTQDQMVEEIIFRIKFKHEDYSPDDFNDWVSENPKEAFDICLRVAKYLI